MSCGLVLGFGLMDKVAGVVMPHHFANVENQIGRLFPFHHEVVDVLSVMIAESNVSIPHKKSISILFVFVAF
jgi:hypothetical protein